MRWNAFWAVFNFAAFWVPGNYVAPANMFVSGALFATLAIDMVRKRKGTSSS